MNEITVTIEQGTLRGKTDVDHNGRLYYAFLGIPYAKPPLGELRFKAPRPPEKWEGIRDATKDGSSCSGRQYTKVILGSENCLVLNVYTPQLSNDKDMQLRPVMVYIYGSGFVLGVNNLQIFGPQFLITGNVVLVVINYRLGLLGFLAFDDPTLGVPGNAGCKDMVMALKWIKSNIMSFGGDPSNVTIFGDSSGAACVHLLVLSSMAKNLFHKAIMQSGCALNPWCLSKPSTFKLAQALRCPYTKEKDILRYLQTLPMESILDAQDRIPNEFRANFVRFIGPVIEKCTTNEPAFLHESPLAIIRSGNYNHVHLIIGYTDKEGKVMEILEKRWDKCRLIQDFETVVPHTLNLEKGSQLSITIAKKIQEFYFGNQIPDSNDKYGLCLVHSDTYFIRNIYDTAKRHLIYSQKPLYLYRFAVDAGLSFYTYVDNLEIKGAAHRDDLCYLFKMLHTPNDLDSESIELKSMRRMVTMWTNFAKTGDPNPVEGALWKAATVNEMNFLDIGVELQTAVNPDENRMKFWDDIYKLALTFSGSGFSKRSVL